MEKEKKKTIKRAANRRYFEADFYFIDAGENSVPLFTVIPRGARLSRDEENLITILKARECKKATIKKVRAIIVFN